MPRYKDRFLSMNLEEYRASESELSFQRWVEGLARRHGWRLYHANVSIRDERGFPDLVLTRTGRLIFAELKKEGGKTSLDQEGWLEDLRAAPGPPEVYLWYPHQRDEIEQILL